MKKTAEREEKIKALELSLQNVNSAVIELEREKFSKRYLNQLKTDLENLNYSVFYTNSDKKGKIYHLHIKKLPNIKNA